MVIRRAFQQTYPQLLPFGVTKFHEVLERIRRLWHA